MKNNPVHKEVAAESGNSDESSSDPEVPLALSKSGTVKPVRFVDDPRAPRNRGRRCLATGELLR